MAGEIATLKKRLAWAEGQLVHVDATLHLLDPLANPGAIPATRPQKRIKLFRQGELGRLIIDALRRSGKPLRVQDVVAAVLAAGGHSTSARPAMDPRVRGNLAYLEKRGKVAKTGKASSARWSLTP